MANVISGIIVNNAARHFELYLLDFLALSCNKAMESFAHDCLNKGPLLKKRPSETELAICTVPAARSVFRGRESTRRAKNSFPSVRQPRVC